MIHTMCVCVCVCVCVCKSFSAALNKALRKSNKKRHSEIRYHKVNHMVALSMRWKNKLDKVKDRHVPQLFLSMATH